MLLIHLDYFIAIAYHLLLLINLLIYRLLLLINWLLLLTPLDFIDCYCLLLSINWLLLLTPLDFLISYASRLADCFRHLLFTSPWFADCWLHLISWLLTPFDLLIAYYQWLRESLPSLLFCQISKYLPMCNVTICSSSEWVTWISNYQRKIVELPALKASQWAVLLHGRWGGHTRSSHPRSGSDPSLQKI